MSARRLLFVCTANISRSPYAERRARQVLRDWDVSVASAGVPGFDGRAMDPEMAALLEARGGDASGHVSRPATLEILKEADVVLVFEFAQHMRIFEADSQVGARVLSLGQLAKAARIWSSSEPGVPEFSDVATLVRRTVDTVGMNSMSFDVDDPYNRGRKAAMACADQIDRHLDQVLPLLAGSDLPALRPQPASPRLRWRVWG